MNLLNYISAGIATGFLIYSWIEGRRIEITETEINCRRLPSEFDGFTILHLTDLHLRKSRAFASLIMEALNCIRADLVAITGDVTYKTSGLPLVEEVINSLKRQLPDAPIYACTGNGEILHPDAGEKTLEIIKSYGGTVLRNSNAVITKGKSRFYILGVEDPFTHSDDLSKALEGVADDDFKVLLAHSPHIAKEAIQSGIDVMLCGHTHGGQVRMPFFGAIYARTGFKRALSAGLYSGKQLARAAGIQGDVSSKVFISRGLGTSHLPIRFLCKPEMAIIRLRKSS